MEHEIMNATDTPPVPAEPADVAEAVAQVATPTPAQGRRPRRGLAILAGAVVVVLTVGASAAFASSPSAAPATASVPNASSGPIDATAADAAFKSFAACMRDHGIDLPDPVVVSSDAAALSGDPTPAGLPEGGTMITGSSVLVPVGTTQTATGSIDDKAMQAASEACAPILEAAGIHAGSGTIVTGGADISGSLSGPITGAGTAGVVAIGVAGSGDVTKIAADMTSYAACMRSHGVEVPDPVVDATNGGVQLQLTGDPASASFRAADAACATSGFPGFQAPPAPAAAQP